MLEGDINMDDNRKPSGIVPLLVFFFIVAMANVFLFVWLIPKMMGIFIQFPNELPPPAELVLSMSVFFRKNIFLLLPLILFSLLGASIWAMKTKNKSKCVSVISILVVLLFIFGGIVFIFTFLPIFHHTFGIIIS
jgi:type II secretory pathway component PulF